MERGAREPESIPPRTKRSPERGREAMAKEEGMGGEEEEGRGIGGIGSQEEGDWGWRASQRRRREGRWKEKMKR